MIMVLIVMAISTGIACSVAYDRGKTKGWQQGWVFRDGQTEIYKEEVK